MKLTVNVTQEDIDKGTRWSNLNCPIARALGHAIGGYLPVVGLKMISMRHDIDLSRSEHALTPELAAAFIRAFDEGLSVQPFSFKLELSK